MKLQLLIPQFNETDEVMRPMLESISIQQGVDLKNDIEVLIGNDGSDTKLSEEFLGSFSFPIRYVEFDHSGLPGTRGRLYDLATADYVMFCDADDMFLTNTALYTILAFCDKGFDALVVDFMEEVIDRRTGRSLFFPHKKDSTFVHGKIYRRQFLLDNGIVWHPDVKCHEDSGYNCLALKVAKDVKYCQMPLYLWKWREGSICRKDPLYVPKTYTRMIYSNGWLVKDFLDRGMVEEAKYYTALLVYGTYYMLNKPIWLDPMNVQYRYETEKCFGSIMTCPQCGKPLLQKFIPVQDRRKGSGWCCEEGCGNFIIRGYLVEEAVLKAYSDMSPEAVKTKVETAKTEKRKRAAELMLKYKAELPEMDRVDFYWVDDLIDHITFGLHSLTSKEILEKVREGGKPVEDRTISVFWKCGLKTTLRSGVSKDCDNPVYLAGLMRAYYERHPDEWAAVK